MTFVNGVWVGEHSGSRLISGFSDIYYAFWLMVCFPSRMATALRQGVTDGYTSSMEVAETGYTWFMLGSVSSLFWCYPDKNP